MAKKKISKKAITSTSLSIIVLGVSIVVFFGFAIPARVKTQNIGAEIGNRAGDAVGKVIGSFDGVTEGLEKGYEEGKEEGESAKDTESEIKSTFAEVGNLEVLEAGVKLNDVNTLGKDYAALYLLKGVAIYSVDLKSAEIKNIGDTIEIQLPDVKVDVYVDEGATQKLAEYQRYSWSGSAEDGFIEYLNSRDAIDKSVEETMGNYDKLAESANVSAKKQVEILANAATGNEKNIKVVFKSEVKTDG